VASMITIAPLVHSMRNKTVFAIKRSGPAYSLEEVARTILNHSIPTTQSSSDVQRVRYLPPRNEGSQFQIDSSVLSLEDFFDIQMGNLGDKMRRASALTLHEGIKQTYVWAQNQMKVSIVPLAPDITDSGFLPFPACPPIDRTRTVVVLDMTFDKHRMGMVNQMLQFSRAVGTACARGGYIAGTVIADAYGDENDRLDISSFVDVELANLRLASNAFKSVVQCPANSYYSKITGVVLEGLECNATRYIPRTCVEQLHLRKEVLKPYVPQRYTIPLHLPYLMPVRGYPWFASNQPNFKLAHPYNALALPFDLDRLILMCTGTQQWHVFASMSTGQRINPHFLNYFNRHYGTDGTVAWFVRERVVPEMVSAMLATFVRKDLPVVVCSTLGKLTNVTNWIIMELQQAIRTAKVGTDVVLGGSTHSQRELQAASELNVLLHAQSVVLSPFSTWSLLAASALKADNKSYSYHNTFSCERSDEIKRRSKPRMPNECLSNALKVREMTTVLVPPIERVFTVADKNSSTSFSVKEDVTAEQCRDSARILATNKTFPLVRGFGAGFGAKQESIMVIPPLWTPFHEYVARMRQQGHLKSIPRLHKYETLFAAYHNHFARFRGQNVTMLEVGVQSGGSILMWRWYFGQGLQYYGVDVDPKTQQFDNADNIRIIVGSQSDPGFWDMVRAKVPLLDIFLDDGGHTMEQQVTTFRSMFSSVKPTGVYACEDLSTSYWPQFGGSPGAAKPNTMLGLSKRMVDWLHAPFLAGDPTRYQHAVEHLEEPAALNFSHTALSVHHYQQIVVVEKGTVTEVGSVLLGDRFVVPMTTVQGKLTNHEWDGRSFTMPDATISMLFASPASSFASSLCYLDADSDSSWLYALHYHTNNLGEEFLSQRAQDVYIEKIFEKLGTTRRDFVEFGFNSAKYGGTGANTHRLYNEGWRGLLLDGEMNNPAINLHAHYLFRSNIAEIFARYNVSTDLDYLSSDMDSHDIFVLLGILEAGFRPRVLSAEFNSNYGLDAPLAMLDPSLRNRIDSNFALEGGSLNHQHVGCAWGTSARALISLANRFGYTLVGRVYVNDLFFVRSDLINPCWQVPDAAFLFSYPTNVQKMKFPHLNPQKDSRNVEKILDFDVYLETGDVAKSLSAGLTTLQTTYREHPCWRRAFP
jgi:hypothetical protein